MADTRVRGVYGKPWAALMNLKVSDRMLRRIGETIVKILERESKKDFAKRGWSGKDPMGGPDIWDSFSFRVHKSSVEILSSFYGMKELAMGDIPERRMTWLTQQGQGRLSKSSTTGGRRPGSRKKPLIVPLKEKTGEVVFRVAPLKIGDAWVHPGIAKFTFFERSLRMAREACKVLLAEEIRRELQGDKGP